MRGRPSISSANHITQFPWVPNGHARFWDPYECTGVLGGCCGASRIFAIFSLSCRYGERALYFLAEIRLARNVIFVHQKRRRIGDNVTLSFKRLCGSLSYVLKIFEIPSVNFKLAKIARAVKNMNYNYYSVLTDHATRNLERFKTYESEPSSRE